MKNEFVMVPRELIERALDEAVSDWWLIDGEWGPCDGGLEGAISRDEGGVIPDLREILAKPADQQGEPVAWRYRHSKPGMSWFFTEKTGADGCLIDGFDYEVQSLYAHADPGEVERLRKELGNTQALLDQANYHKAQRGGAIDALRAQLAALRELKLPEFLKLSDEMRAAHAQLAERDALLRECVANKEGLHYEMDLLAKINTALSARAEPSAPVEIDERAAFDAWTVRKGRVVGYCGWREDFAIWQARAALERKS